MSFFRRLFGQKKVAADELFPRKLLMPFEPTVATMPQLAEWAVGELAELEGIELDGSAASLEIVDELLLHFHAERFDLESGGGLVFAFGCYAGEVFVHTLQGQWCAPGDTALPRELATGNIPLVQLERRLCNPIAKAFKCVRLGAGDTLAPWYEWTARQLAA